MPRIQQPSFAAGELAPTMAGRSDLAKYRIGLKTLLNFFVHPHGGASNRPGTRYCATALGVTRLIPFRFSVEQSYVLEFSDFKMRVLVNGALVETAPGVPLEVVSPFAVAHLFDVTYCQSADVLFFAHPSYPPQQLVRTSYVDWAFSTMAFTIAALPPTGLAAAYNDGDDTPDATRIIKYQVSSVLENGEESLPTAAVSVTADSPWYAGATVAVSWTANPDAIGYRLYKNSRGMFGQIGNLTRDTAAIASVTPLSSGDDPAHLKAAAFDKSVTTYWRSLAPSSPAIYIGQDFGADHTVTGFRIRQGPTDASCVNSVLLEYSTDNLTWTVLETFAIQKQSEVWQQFAISGTPVVARYWRLNSNQAMGNHWRIQELEFMEAGIPTSFTDDNINEDVSLRPPESRNPFAAPGDYPGTVAIFQQRLVFGRTDNQPQSLWFSRTGVFNNMAYSTPQQADDAIDVTLGSEQVNEIKHLISMRQLILLTKGNEWVIASGSSNSDAVTPHSISARVQGNRGANGVRPAVIGRDILFVQRNGNVVRQLGYQIASDGYESNELSVIANHMFEGYSIVDWAYQQSPYSILWVVRNDGVLLGLTYLREQDVWAWHRHTTDGFFESVCTADDGAGQDEIYFVVKRNIGGNDVRYIEKLAHRLPAGVLEDGVFMDSSWTYDGAPTTVFGNATHAPGNLDHLEGETVVVMADGGVIEGKVVTDGTITLENAASVVHVGLPYTCDLETLQLEYDSPPGVVSGRKKRICRTDFQVHQTRAFFFGPTFDATDLVEAKIREHEKYNEATNMLTGDIQIAPMPRWSLDGVVCIRVTAPVPVTILSIIPNVETSGT